jgi:transaldolase
MEIFVDSADIEEIRKVAHLVDGVTTNPSLAAKQGKDFKQLVTEICQVIDGPISAEVVALNHEDMVREGVTLSQLHPNIVVKVPLTEEGLKATKMLSEKGIKTNVTLCFSANQALLAAKAGATYVSPFIGRLDDIGQTGMDLIEEIVTIYENYGYTTKVLAASIRNTIHVKDAALIGAHIATCPPKIIHQMMQHTLTDKGLKKFMEDWQKLNQTI